MDKMCLKQFEIVFFRKKFKLFVFFVKISGGARHMMLNFKFQ